MKRGHPFHVEQLLKLYIFAREDLINPWRANIREGMLIFEKTEGKEQFIAHRNRGELVNSTVVTRPTS
jgi:hypothetical protein